jgi:hypothetical protein
MDDYYDYGDEAWDDLGTTNTDYDYSYDVGDDYWGDIFGGNDYTDYDDYWGMDVFGTDGYDISDDYWGDLSAQEPSVINSIGTVLKNLGISALNNLKSVYQKPGGGTDWSKIAATAGGLYGLYGSMNQKPQQPTGYQGGIPQYTAVRERVAGTPDPNRRPGGAGLQYFSDTQYAAPANVEAARAAAQEQAAGIAAAQQMQQAPEQQTEQPPEQQMAGGGIAALAKGRYLRGNTDGMEDKLRTTIENEQPAALSHGEFVVPADVVSHLGNGNSDAGAKRLYEMMDRIRVARTGNKKQGKQVNPNKYLPA